MKYRYIKGLVKITSREHPHFGETGYLNKNNRILSTNQYEIYPENCKHATWGYFATPDEFESIPDREASSEQE